MANNAVRACWQRLFYCELVASIHLSSPQSRHCDRVRCLKILCEGPFLLYGFVCVCGDKECLHAACFSSRWFHFSNQWLVFSASSPRVIIVHGWGFLPSQPTIRVAKGNDTGNVRSESDWRNPRVSDLLIASLISLMNSASQCLCPEWQHGTGDWVGSGDSKGVRCHLLCHCALHFRLLRLNRREKQQWKILSRWWLRPPPPAFWSFTRARQELVATSENF